MAVRPWIKEKYAAWSYSLLGPTTLHLKHEGFLWISLSILTISSLQALYRNSFGCRGDFIFVLLASVWLSRHMILRCIYTADVSTSRSPTLTGVIVHWLASVTVAGQYFDRSDVQVVSKNVGIAHVEDVLNPTSPFSIPSLNYTMHLFRALLLDPGLRLLGHPRFFRAALSFLSSFKDSLWRPSFQRLAYYGPPLQLLLTSGVFAFYLFHFQEKTPLKRTETHAISMQPSLYQDSSTNAGHGSIDPEGAYDPLSSPSWARIFFFMSCGGTMLSVWLYGRISFPIPDLVAGTNVLKALRNEGKGTSGKSQKGRVQKDLQDGPWAEVYKSIVVENRFRLACTVSLLRIIDALFCCAILPRTVYVCRATGHCPSSPAVQELSQILYPQGISEPYREDRGYTSMFESINPDRGSAVITILSVVVVSAVILLAQLITLNKSYLATMGHLAGEWKLVQRKGKEVASQWDPRRRYKKGDMIVYSYPGFRQSIYMATTNSPEGRPFDFFLRATHDLFRHELGHQSTSEIITSIVKVHVAFMAIISCTILYYMIMGYSEQSLVTTLFANMVACCGVLQTGLIDYNELEDVAAKVNAS